MTRKSDPLRKPTKDERDAQHYALKLKAIFQTQNAAADVCGISRARMSHMINGNFGEVAITQTDVKVMQAIYEYRKLRGQMSEEARKLLDRLEVELAEANRANQQTARTARQVIRILAKV
jgi:hypothetical protein